jgi:DNA-binding NtrC family response regulator
MDRASLQERFGILGNSPALHRVIDRIRQVARTDIAVLVQGESGVGKELVAQAIHAIGPRKHGPIVTVNCGAIPEGLIESELFGAEKGAYTGSVERRTGYFEQADGGTIFLDEIGEMPLQAQVRLLRVLETGSFTRVGASAEQRVDVRVVAATNRDLGHEVQRGRFREDLYYRLATILIEMPPLRERAGDVVLLFRHFLHQFVQRYDAGRRELMPDAEELLTTYAWPGNVRELRNVAEQAVVLHPQPQLTADSLRPFLRSIQTPAPRNLLPARLTPDPGAGDASGGDDRERELLYRALLELRLDVRDLKEQMAGLISGLNLTREDFERFSKAPRGNGFVIVRDDPPFTASSYDTSLSSEQPDEDDEVEDAPFEFADAGRTTTANEPEPIRPIEEVERELILDALERFDGNRRQSAEALGISERTLYRKIRELEARGIDV